MIAPLAVGCLHCGSGPGAVCLTPPWPGKGQESRRPLTFSVAHPIRVAYAAALDAGATGTQATAAAYTATNHPAGHDVALPFLEVARAAIRTEQATTITNYRQQHPPAPDPTAPIQPAPTPTSVPAPPPPLTGAEPTPKTRQRANQSP